MLYFVRRVLKHSGEGLSEAFKVDKILKEQIVEIKMLKKNCAELICVSDISGAKRKFFLQREEVLLETEVKGEIKGNGIVFLE